MDSAFIDKSVTARKPHKLSTSRSIVPDEPENEPSTQQESGEHGLHASLPQLPGKDTEKSRWSFQIRG